MREDGRERGKKRLSSQNSVIKHSLVTQRPVTTPQLSKNSPPFNIIKMEFSY